MEHAVLHITQKYKASKPIYPSIHSTKLQMTFISRGCYAAAISADASVNLILLPPNNNEIYAGMNRILSGLEERGPS